MNLYCNNTKCNHNDYNCCEYKDELILNELGQCIEFVKTRIAVNEKIREYNFKVTEIDNKLSIQSINDGFSALELLGIFELKIDDIKDQMSGNIKPDIIKRTVVQE